MNRKILIRSSIILLICVFAFAHTFDNDNDNDYRYNRYDDEDDDGYRSNYRKSKKYKNRDGGMDGYYDKGYDVVGEDGTDPSQYGTDVGDFGPVYDYKRDMNASLTLWITAVDDWEQKGSGKYNKQRYNNRKNYKDNDYKNDKDDDYKSDNRRKRSHSQVRFPVTKVQNYRKFPLHRFPPLISIAPWLPIFYDRLTYQTFIFSPIGGLIIIPPLINFYGKRFAVAQLIKWGYASLVSTGAPPPPAVDVAPFVQPAPPGGPVPTGVVGSKPSGPPPVYDSKRHQYNNGVKTDFPNFRPRNNANYLESGGNYGGRNTQ